ncbi:MAG: hypothetical protein R2827_14480 [Bdellovibrionales bacterium]
MKSNVLVQLQSLQQHHCYCRHKAENKFQANQDTNYSLGKMGKSETEGDSKIYVMDDHGLPLILNDPISMSRAKIQRTRNYRNQLNPTKEHLKTCR